MRRALVTALLALLAASAGWAQKKKVVVMTRMGAESVRAMQEAAPDLNIVAVENRERLLAEAPDAEGFIGNPNPAFLRAAKKLRWIQTEGAGIERVLTPELRDSQITLTNCKILQGPEIADHAMALLLALTRELYIAIPNRAREEWAQKAHKPVELLGKTAVVIGVGGIGTQIAVRAHACGMKVIGVDPKEIPYMPFLVKTVPPDRLDTVLPQADVVFISAPHTPQSEGMMGPRQFELMKKGSYFITVSRGKLYNTEALVKALDSRRLAGAGLDVTDPEPLPKGHALWKFENVVITPHIAGRSDGEFERDLDLFKENLRRFAAGEPLLNVVDKQKGY